MKSLSHIWLCNAMDCSLPGSSVHGIFQARVLKWVAISFSNAWKWKVKVKLVSCVQLFVTAWTGAYQVPPSMGFSRQEYWSGVPSPSPIVSSVNAKYSYGCNSYDHHSPLNLNDVIRHLHHSTSQISGHPEFEANINNRTTLDRLFLIESKIPQKEL